MLSDRIHLGITYLDKLIACALFLNHSFTQSEALEVIGLRSDPKDKIILHWIEMFRRDGLIDRDGWFVESKENFCGSSQTPN